MVASWSDQAPYRVRFEWGPAGLGALATDIVVVVDVLRFTTAVDAGVSHGIAVYPYRWRDQSAVEFAGRMDAQLADGEPGSPSLSPGSLTRLEPGGRVVLPSPNGSTCAALASAAGAIVVAACLRNAGAVSSWLARQRGSISVIACGERWPDGSLRPSLEDHLAAGAVLAGLGEDVSPEARAAVAVWRDSEARIAEVMAACTSGRELLQRGWADDLRYASQVNASQVVPILIDGAFHNAQPTDEVA
jgi:2-phosphosulfolactate phosphatase